MGPGFHVSFELCGGAFRVSGLIDALVGRIGEHRKTVRIAGLGFTDNLLEPITTATGEVHHHGHVELVHIRDHLIDVFGRHTLTALMVVGINEGEAGARYGVLRNHQGGFGLILLKPHLMGGNTRWERRGDERSNVDGGSFHGIGVT